MQKVKKKKGKVMDIIQSTRSLGCFRIILKIVSRYKSVTVWKDADDFFNLVILYDLWAVALAVNDPTRHHWRCWGEVAIWRSTILLFRINAETDSDERKRSRSDAEKERGITCLTKTSEGDDDGRDEWVFTKYVREGEKSRDRITTTLWSSSAGKTTNVHS